MEGARSTVRRFRKRELPREAAADILREALVAHVGIVEDGQPYVLPMAYLYRDGFLYFHGAPASRLLRYLASGAPVCVEVTLLDGRIASKTAQNHSLNHRSVVCFGRGQRIPDVDRQRALLEAVIGRYFPGRTAGKDYRHLTDTELAGSCVVEVTIEELSVKGRSGGPTGPLDDDPTALGSCGIFPLPNGAPGGQSA
jgi:hypothetical protein